VTPAARRRAEILGRTILLGYRLSGGAPKVLADSRLRVAKDRIRLEVGKVGGAPDSEVVAERMNLLAAAVGVKKSEIVERG
jgi:exopolyphosphatase/guanosine-5'-triphosphate,3'-diphosphate pyrophosphatase